MVRKAAPSVEKIHKWKQACLLHLQTFLRFGEPDGRLVRTFVDSWYAMDRGGPLLEPSGRPLWLNNPDPRKVGPALLACDFVSANALTRIQRGEMGLIKDHAIPVRVLRERLAALEDTSAESIEALLRRFYAVGVITTDEDRRLNSKRLNNKMPAGWDGVSKFARYEAADIERGLIPVTDPIQQRPPIATAI